MFRIYAIGWAVEYTNPLTLEGLSISLEIAPLDSVEFIIYEG